MIVAGVWRSSSGGRELLEKGKDASESSSEDQPAIPKPSEYMRSNRPYLFSDSVRAPSVSLERSELEYQLETLTARKQENVFENFCRRLAEVEICPNLRPQTGPLGGGDSQTDSSTYPVAPTLVERCYWGSPSAPSNEKWAFAFSCMKKWTTKVRSDVRKIAKLDVKWSKIFFVTSQFARDKTRARIEDELSKECGIEVCILDREWIIDRVFSHKREAIAIEELEIIKSQPLEKRTGPTDTARRNELDDLLTKLREPLRHFSSDYGIAGAYLHAAVLARGLELPRHEVAGFFSQARQMAKKTKYVPQIVRAAYEHAWADNWWYDDIETAVQVYEEIEPHLKTMTEAAELEMYANLQSLMWVATMRGELDPESEKLWDRHDDLVSALQDQADDQSYPSNALQAETMLRFLELQPWNDDEGRSHDDILRDLANCFERSRNLPTYPLTRFTDSVVGLADFLEPSEGFDFLFGTMGSLIAERDGEVAVARLLMQQGQQLQKASRGKEAAIVLLRASVKAAKEECLELSIDAAFRAATCLTGEGTILAARLPALYAASLSCQWAATEFHSAWFGSRSSRLLAWLDLSQGRLSAFLRWMGLTTNCLQELLQDGYEVANFSATYNDIERHLCGRLMCLGQEQIDRCSSLPQPLRWMGFQMAYFVVMYRTGRSDEIKSEWMSAYETTSEQMHEVFAKWEHESASLEVQTYLDDQVFVTECKLSQFACDVRSDAEIAVMTFADDVLGILELLLSTNAFEGIKFAEARIDLSFERGTVENADSPIVGVFNAEVPDRVRVVIADGAENWLTDPNNELVPSVYLRICSTIVQMASVQSNELVNQCVETAIEKVGIDSLFLSVPSLDLVAQLIGSNCYQFIDDMFDA